MADINFGSGPNTNTGNTVNAAFSVLQNRVTAIETLGVPPSLTFSAPFVSNEGTAGSTYFNYTLTLRRNGSTLPYPYTWSVTGSGTNPANAADFVGGVFPSGSGVFASGETIKQISISVQGDNAVEPDENFTISANSVFSLMPVSVTGTIVNDEPPTRDYNLYDSPIAPTIWVDTTDTSTMALDANNRLAVWGSKGATTQSFNAVSAAKAPLFVANGINGIRPGLRFDSTRYDLLQASFNGPATGTAIYVWQQGTTFTTYENVVDHKIGGGAQGPRGTIFTSFGTAKVDIQTQYFDYSPGGNSANQVNVLVAEYNGSSSRVYFNGKLIASGVNLGSSMSGIGLAIGGKDAGTAFNGTFAEFAIIPGLLTGDDFDKLTQGLMWKYGLQSQIATGAAYKDNAPYQFLGTSVVPKAPIAIGTAGTGQVVLNWADGFNGNAAITAHKIYAGTASGAQTLLMTVTSGSSYTHTGLTTGTPMYYKISAVNSAGESPLSAEITVTPA